SFCPVRPITLPSSSYSIRISGLTLSVRKPVSRIAVPSSAGAPQPVRRTADITAREDTAASKFLLIFIVIPLFHFLSITFWFELPFFILHGKNTQGILKKRGDEENF